MALVVLTLIPGRKTYSRQHRLTFTWNQNPPCPTPIVVAQECGFFEKNGLRTDLINYSGLIDQLFESIVTGRADAAVSVIHRWFKPLETGSDVKIISSSRGGCIRLVGSKAVGVIDLAALGGKTVGMSDLTAPGKHFSTTLLVKNGIDSGKDVTWRQYSTDLLDVVVDKGGVQMIADGDPNLYLPEKRTNDVYVELVTNLSDGYARKACCVIGAWGELMRNDRPAAPALARSIVQAMNFISENSNEAVKVFAKYSPKVALDGLHKLYATFTYTHHSAGIGLRDETAFYVGDFRRIGAIKKTTDSQRPVQHVYVNVLT